MISLTGRRPRGRVVLATVLALGLLGAALAVARGPASPDAEAAGLAPAAAAARQVDTSSLAAGGEHSCSASTAGRAWCWGRNTYGQVGNGARGTGPKAPYRIGSGSTWTQVAAGGATSCGIVAAGSLYCWGLNNEGQLGLGDRKIRTKPDAGRRHRVAPGLGRLVQHVCGQGGQHRAGAGRELQPTGRRRHHQDPATRAHAGEGRRGLEQISTGFEHTCGIKTDGTLWCWGRNTFGQVGNGTTADVGKPTQIGTANNWCRDLHLLHPHLRRPRHRGPLLGSQQPGPDRRRHPHRPRRRDAPSRACRPCGRRGRGGIDLRPGDTVASCGAGAATGTAPSATARTRPATSRSGPGHLRAAERRAGCTSAA